MKAPAIVSSPGRERGSEQDAGPRTMNYCSESEFCALKVISVSQVPVLFSSPQEGIS